MSHFINRSCFEKTSYQSRLHQSCLAENTWLLFHSFLLLFSIFFPCPKHYNQTGPKARTIITGSAEEIRAEALGECGSDCKGRCEAKHPGGQGRCDTRPGNSTCICQYGSTETNPAKNKRCRVASDECNAQCDDACCDNRCFVQYPGGTGSCYSPISPFVICLCSYDC